MDLGHLLAIIVGAIFVSNFVLMRYLGLCPFVGVSKDLDSAVGMGMAVIFVMTLASLATWLVYELVLVPLGIVYMRTIAFILVIAALVQFVEMVLEKTSPALHRSLGIYLPLITTNCAVMGIALLNTEAWRDPANGLPVHKATFNGFCGGVGFLLAMVLMSGIRERLAESRVPQALRGLPIAFISAGLMALAFMGFSKLFGIAG